MFIVNDTQQGTVFYSVQYNYKNGWLADSDLFHYLVLRVHMFENVIYQIDNKFLSVSFTVKFELVFSLNTGKRFFLEVSF